MCEQYVIAMISCRLGLWTSMTGSLALKWKKEKSFNDKFIFSFLAYRSGYID